ncbi:MAG: YcxB family protein [Acidobacteriota bacterium]
MPDSDALTVSGTLQVEDVIRFTYYHQFRRSRLGPIMVIGMILMAAAALILRLLQHEADPERLSLEVVVIPALWAAVMIAYPYFQARRQFAKVESLRRPAEYRIDRSQLQCDGFGSSGQMLWNRVDSVRETGSAFLVYLSPYVAWVIPKRFFDSQLEEVERFRQMAALQLAKPGLFKRPRRLDRFL